MGKTKNKTVRSSGLIVIIIVIAIIAVVAIILLNKGGLGFGSGDGKEDGDAIQVNATVSETAVETTLEEIVTEEITYIEITISENDYLYQNKQIELEELISELTSAAEKTPVKITDDNASQKAYSKLVEALEENNISFIEETTE